MATEALPAPIQALRRRAAFPGRGGRVDLIQTHLSYVFLVGEEVFKIKKAIDLGFADFTTLEKRRKACEDEVRLNRRGCEGGTYIGVVTLNEQSDSYRINGAGKVVDYAVHMKRLPADRMMDRLLERDAVTFEMIGRVAARLSALHSAAERGPRITRLGGHGVLLQNWRENFDQASPFIGRSLSRVRYQRLEKYATGFLKREAPLLELRDDEGWVRDCHGDLRSDSVVFDESLPGGICIYDCIEFNDRFRYLDTALDAAFLAMDLDYRGRSDLSDLFIGLFTAASDDKRLPLLLDFYKCYRAVVRGKVESLLMADTGVPASQRSAARRRARAYFALAESYARRPDRDGIVLVTGPSGSGKSVLAGVLAARLNAVLLSTDMVRIDLYGLSEEKGAGIDQDRYTPAARERVYEEIARQTETFVAEGRPVVIDGTYIERSRRAPIVEVASRSKTALLVVECSAPDDVVRQRQTQRKGEVWTTSEGRWEVYLEQKMRIEPATELPASQRVQMDTTRPLPEQVDAVEAKLVSTVTKRRSGTRRT